MKRRDTSDTWEGVTTAIVILLILGWVAAMGVMTGIALAVIVNG